jgi:hypothetical protein
MHPGLALCCYNSNNVTASTVPWTLGLLAPLSLWPTSLLLRHCCMLPALPVPFLE